MDKGVPWKKIFVSDDKFVYPDSDGVFDFWENFCCIYGCLPDQKIKEIWEDNILLALSDAYPCCQWDKGKLSYPGKNTASEEQKRDMEEMHDFLNGKWLEYAAYKAFKSALTTSKEERKNFKLFRNVHVRRLNPSTDDTRIRPFELDVVAVLGYQIVVVSCTVSSSPRHD